MEEKKKGDEKGSAPEVHHYEAMRERWIKMSEHYKTGKRVVKFKELQWQLGRQGLLRWCAGPHKKDMAAPGWMIFHHHIEKHSGKHIHQGGLPIYVLEGKGYSVVDGVRYDWKKGDLLLLPIKPGGVEHQHFNEEQGEAADWIAVIWYPFLDFMANTTKQVESHPDWPSGR